MKSDAEIERLLEDLLVEDAEPMPLPVLEAVLDGVSRHSQERPRASIGFGWLSRGVAAIVLAAVVILAIVIAPGVLPQLQAALRSATGAGPDEAMHWDAMRGFREDPIQLNPAPDGYGHAVVFTYLRSGGAVHDPARYVPLPEFESDGLQSWYDRELVGLYVGFALGDEMLTLHPYGGGVDARAAIVAWRSPVEASVKVSGRVEVDATCGDGIIFSIDHGGESVETFVLPNGSRTFERLVDGLHAGEVLYFIVEPGADSRCDTTRFNVTIDTY